jgi:hypothetical protein
MRFHFGKSQPTPTPRVIPVVCHEIPKADPLTEATSIARKAKLTNAIAELPDDHYALLITMMPTPAGDHICRAHVYPEGKDAFFYVGLEDAAMRFLHYRNG